MRSDPIRSGPRCHVPKPASRCAVRRWAGKTPWLCWARCALPHAADANGSFESCRLRDALFLVLVLAVAGAWSARLPLDGHEVFVAQTAQEMLQRGDWLVPYFNGEPRLTKPPLNYWLTAFFAWLSGAGHVLPEHARAVSVFAGVGVCALTLAAGRLLFPQQGRIAAGAALMLASSAGFFTFTHDARSDMLYTLLCMGGVTAFIRAWRRGEGGEPTGWAPYLAWSCYGLATLAKGPHIPALFVLACALFAGYARVPWGKWGELFRPLSGLALFAAIALPWWWLLRQEVGAEVFAASQLSGNLLTGHGKHWFTPYYFYRSLPLMAPWLAPVLAALWSIGRCRPAAETALLLLLAFIPAIALGLGSQQRPVYILPALPWLFLLLAKFATAPLGAQPRVVAWAIPAQWLLILIGGGWLWLRADESLRAEIPGPTLLALAACGAVWLACLIRRRRQNLDTGPDMTGTAVLLCLSYILAGGTPLVWGAERYARSHLEPALQKIGGSHIPIVSLDESSEVYVYYANRHIEKVADMNELGRLLEKDGELAVIARPEAQDQFPPGWQVEILARMPPVKGSRALFLLRRPG